MITARLSLVQRTSVSTAKPSSAAEVRDSNVCNGYFSSPPRWARMSEPVGSSAVDVFDALLDGAVVTEGGLEVGCETALAVRRACVRIAREIPHSDTNAASKTIETATATNMPVRLRTVPVRTGA